MSTISEYYQKWVFPLKAVGLTCTVLGTMSLFWLGRRQIKDLWCQGSWKFDFSLFLLAIVLIRVRRGQRFAYHYPQCQTITL